jgi:hypothetical protein
VTGHAEGSAASSSNDVSSAFATDTSATITVIYHYIPNLPGLAPPASAGSGTNAAPISATGVVPGTHKVHAAAVGSDAHSIHAGQHGSSKIRIASLHRHHPRQHDLARRRAMQVERAHHHGPGSIIDS